MNNQPILSICIPTYNRAEKLKICVECVLKSIGNYEDIELIISDNCSLDNTKQVLSEYTNRQNVFIYRNESNVGFNGNMSLLIDKYARGLYCWIIGDDDYLDSDSIKLIYPLLHSKKYKFISVAHRCMSPEQFACFALEDDRKLYYYEYPFFRSIDENASGSNVLGTFMSTHIFDTKKVKSFDKSIFTVNNWKDFMLVFPNSYMMVSCFHKEKCCGCVRTPLITAISYHKSWDDKLNKIVRVILPQYLEYCLGIDEGNFLRKNKRIVTMGVLNSQLSDIKGSSGIINKINYMMPRFYPLYLYFLIGGINGLFCKMVKIICSKRSFGNC